MNKLPLIMIGSFLINDKDEIYLRTKPGKETGFRCLNEQLLEGVSIEETIKRGLKEKTGLVANEIKLLNVSEGFDIPKDGIEYHMVFIDHLVSVSDLSKYNVPEDRLHKWQTREDWLNEDTSIFAPYIRNSIELVKD